MRQNGGVQTIKGARFQSTHPRGVRHHPLPCASRPCYFNPRTHVGCDVEGANMGNKYSEFQSTHPRGVRPGTYDSVHNDHNISIHAPTWGATRRQGGCASVGAISIHAPTWGATARRPFVVVDESLFQSTHPRGVRRVTLTVRVAPKTFQSTHPRGVRRRSAMWVWIWRQNFNPRTHVGCDLANYRRFYDNVHFNPRTHVGCDQKVSEPSIIQIISIHAPPWGATIWGLGRESNPPISIHAPTWGAT